MELVIVLLVFVLWTNQMLFPKKPEKKKSVEEKLADALKDYLEAGLKIRDK